MFWVAVATLLSAAYPLMVAWWANRHNTIAAAVLWAAAAWLAWLAAFLLPALAIDQTVPALRYLAVVLTLCAPIMILGARRPGVAAWQLVVIGFLVTLLLPVAQGWGTPRLETPWLLFVGIAIGFCVLNYAPTRLGSAALVLGAAALWELLALGQRMESGAWLTGFLAGASVWLGWFMLRHNPPPRLADQIWLAFRERYGIVWGQRVREQFNRAAENASLGVVLAWHGMENITPGPDEKAVEETLRAVLKRFGLAE